MKVLAEKGIPTKTDCNEVSKYRKKFIVSHVLYDHTGALCFDEIGHQ